MRKKILNQLPEYFSGAYARKVNFFKASPNPPLKKLLYMDEYDWVELSLSSEYGTWCGYVSW